jgi:tetratricopeptide (TPR) repeat protein
MNLIQKLKIRKELKRLESRVHESPSPSTFVDLGQVYINLGMHDRTLVLAEEGLALFPHSNELRKLLKVAKKKQLTGRIEELRSLIASTARADLYHELADLYLELGDFDAVQGTCDECLRRFGDDPGTRLVRAKAWLTTFYRDLGAREGVNALHDLRQVVERDPDNLTARRLLAEVLYRIGASAALRPHLDAMERLGSVREAQAMRAQIDENAAFDDVESLFHGVESRGSLARAPLSAGTRTATTEDSGIHGVREALSYLSEIEGVLKAAYIRGTKALVKGDIRDGKDSFLRVVRVVARAAQRAARRMDIGNFNKGVVDGEFGHICMCSYGEVLAAALCDDPQVIDEVLNELQELVANSLVGAAEKDA